jgi:uncharacterized damage-inducible protein DinB
MDKNIQFGKEFWKELEMEGSATRTCLERMKPELFDYKPHDKSMKMGDLVQMLSDMPRWIQMIVDESVIDFATFKRVESKTPEELVKHFDDTMKLAKKALEKATNEELAENFYLKNKGETLMSSSKKENVGSTINHLVHHRGQLTVYMRLNDIPVPSIYGPSADDKSW